MGTRTFVRQDTQVKNSDLYDDTLTPGSTMESASANVENDLNNLRSQLKRLFVADEAGDWFQDIPTINGKKRAVSQLNTDLDDIEEKKVLFRAQILADIAVPGGQNYVVLSQATSQTPAETAAVSSSQNGALVSVLGSGAFGSHALNEIAGSNALSPKNLLIIRDANTGQVIQSSGKDVFGLLQAENGILDGDAFNDGDKRVQISFVRENAGGDDLEAVPAADTAGKTINYSYVRRINFDTIPEQAFLTGVFVDLASVGVDVTLDNAIDNQSGPATQNQNIRWQIADGVTLDFEADGGGRDLLSFKPSAGGDELELNIDTLDINNTQLADFQKGVRVDSNGTSIDLGVAAGEIASAGALKLLSGGAQDLTLSAALEMLISDGNKSGSSFAAPLKLSEDSQEWNDYESQYGEVSLLKAIVKAKVDVKHDKAVAAVTSNVPANTNVSGTGGSPNIDAVLLDYSGKDFVSEVNVYLNGVLLRNGADGSADHDVYPGDNPANGDLKFEFNLRGGGAKPDVLTIEVY